MTKYLDKTKSFGSEQSLASVIINITTTLIFLSQAIESVLKQTYF